MYESPIKVVQGELETQLEGEILKAVHRVGVAVDRDELIRALRYDREQYQKGFDDAKRDAVVVTRCNDCEHYDMGVCLKIYSDGNVHSAAWQKRKPDDFCSYGDPKKETTQSLRP